MNLFWNSILLFYFEILFYYCTLTILYFIILLWHYILLFCFDNIIFCYSVLTKLYFIIILWQHYNLLFYWSDNEYFSFFEIERGKCRTSSVDLVHLWAESTLRRWGSGRSQTDVLTRNEHLKGEHNGLSIVVGEASTSMFPSFLMTYHGHFMI